MDDQISRKAVLDFMKGWKGKGCKGETIEYVRNLPSVPAVPLDKLCEWLQDNAALTYGAHISSHGWKRELTVWMEEQDAKKET